MKLREALEKKNLSFDCFTTFKHGETRIIKSDGTSIVEKASKKYSTSLTNSNANSK